MCVYVQAVPNGLKHFIRRCKNGLNKESSENHGKKKKKKRQQNFKDNQPIKIIYAVYTNGLALNTKMLICTNETLYIPLE